MAATAPVAIGTRGTVGSLVRKEIEYFTKIELDSRKPHQRQMLDMGSSYGHSRPNFWSLRISWKWKKRRGSSNNGFIPSFCSAVEVSDTNPLNGIPGFTYKILKDHVKDITV